MKSMVKAFITTVLVVLPIVLIGMLLSPELFLETFTAVLSGKIFGDTWNRIHAGIALDQPTIGKWYFWFTVFSVTGLTYLAIVRRYWIKSKNLQYWIFVIAATILSLFLLCLLTIPFFWLLQYIGAMGWTPRRLFGLLYGIVGYIVVLSFVFPLWQKKP